MQFYCSGGADASLGRYEIMRPVMGSLTSYSKAGQLESLWSATPIILGNVKLDQDPRFANGALCPGAKVRKRRDAILEHGPIGLGVITALVPKEHWPMRRCKRTRKRPPLNGSLSR